MGNWLDHLRGGRRAPEAQDIESSHLRSVVRSGLAPPDWATAVPRQTAVVVGDASGSMSGEKAQAARDAICGLLLELAAPANKDAFSSAIVSFDTQARLRVARTQAAAALDAMRRMELLDGHGSRTNITAGLEAAEPVLVEAAQSGETTRPVVVLFSDGGHNTGPLPEPVAARLKARADVVTIAFQGGDEELLRRLASSPQHFTRCQDGPTLRQFLVAIGATLSQSARRGGGGSSEALRDLVSRGGY